MTEARKILLGDLAVLALAWAVAFFLVPNYMVALNPADFGNVGASWLRSVSTALFLIFMAASLPVYFILAALGYRSLAQAGSRALLFWLCTAGIAIPISLSAEMVEPNAIPIAPIGLAVVLLITIVLTWLSMTRWWRIAVVYLAVQMAVALVPMAPAIARTFLGGEPPDARSFVSLSATRNILVISLDDLPGGLVSEVLRDDPQLRAAFADFTLFENVTANAPGTVLSIGNELFGSRDFAALAPSQAQLMRRLDLGSLALNDPALNAGAYGSYGAFGTIPDRRIEMEQLAGRPDPRRQLTQAANVFRYVAVRLGTRFLLRSFSELGERGVDLPSMILRFTDAHCAGCDDLTLQLEQHQGASWDRDSLNSLRDFDGLVRDVRATDAPFALRYMHFLFTHFPVDLDENCHYRSGSAAWHQAHQNRDGARAETVCGLRRLARLLNRLREIGVYDRSLIVLKSDHGKMANYYDRPPGNVGLFGNDRIGYDRYRPFLMIKDVGHRTAALTSSDRPAALSDLATTLCRRMPRREDCALYPGVDLLAPRAPQEQDVFIYVPRDASSTHSYDTLRPLRVSRNQDLLSLGGR